MLTTNFLISLLYFKDLPWTYLIVHAVILLILYINWRAKRGNTNNGCNLDRNNYNYDDSQDNRVL